MHLCLFEDAAVPHLLPLVHTRAAYDLHVGMRTIRNAALHAFGHLAPRLHCRPVVAEVTARESPGIPVNRPPSTKGGTLFLNGCWVPGPGPLLDRLLRAARRGEPARVFVQEDDVVAAWWPAPPDEAFAPGLHTADLFGDLPEERVEGERIIRRLWHLIDDLPAVLTRDFDVLAPEPSRAGADVQAGALLAHPERIHLAPGAVVRPGAVLNAEAGPIYVAAEAVVMEGAVVRGPAFLGPRAQVRVAARVDGAAFGSTCKVGGEVHGTVMHSYSNKAHDGFLGNSYIGRWCNLGADSNTSNLKNDYGLLDLYNEHLGQYEETGRQFLGLFMGDHAKCGIDVMFNTATVVGVFCNLFGADYQPRYVPSFVWGSADHQLPYRLEKALQVAEAVLARRNRTLARADREMLARVWETTEVARHQMLRLHEA